MQPVAVQPLAGLTSVDHPHPRDATGITQDADVERASLSCTFHRRPFVRAGSHVGGGGEAVRQHQPLRLGQCRILLGRRRHGNFRFNKAHRSIDKQAVFDPAAGRRLGV
jgi:hypothetical protein